MNPMDLYDMPWDHSLLGALGWAAGFAIVMRLVRRVDRRRGGAVALAARPAGPPARPDADRAPAGDRPGPVEPSGDLDAAGGRARLWRAVVVRQPHARDLAGGALVAGRAGCRAGGVAGGQ